MVHIHTVKNYKVEPYIILGYKDVRRSTWVITRKEVPTSSADRSLQLKKLFNRQVRLS